MEFNGILAFDLVEWWAESGKEKHIIRHMVDKYSRLSSAQLIPHRTPETILNALMREWFCNYGTPRRLLHDRSGEFMKCQMFNS